MKVLGIFTKKKKAEKKQDVYQESLERFGREQLQRLAKKGLSIRVMVL